MPNIDSNKAQPLGFVNDPSFVLSDDYLRAKLIELFSFQDINKRQELTVYIQDTLLQNPAVLASKRKTLPKLIEYYSDLLESTNPVCFSFLKEEQKDRLRKQLLVTFFLLAAQNKIDTVEKRKHAAKTSEKQMASCASLIQRLMIAPDAGQPINPELDLQDRTNQAGQYLHFLGFQVAEWLKDKWIEFCDGKTGTIINWMSEINSKRLYWVWGGGLLTSVLGMLSDDFFRNTQARNVLAAPAPVTGYMSWVLYYARLGINLFLFFKHTMPGPWMSASEKQIPFVEQFKTQWAQRKFALLNDAIWATANMVCFFWLTGSGWLGYYGNVVTVGLLLMDWGLATWQWWEESTKYNAEKLRIANERERLSAMIFNSTEDMEIINKELTNLAKLEKKLDFDWKYQRDGLLSDWVYSAALIISFVLLCSMFFPPSAIIPAIAIAGAALCFVVTLVSTIFTGTVDIRKSKDSAQLVKAEARELLEAFNQLKISQEALGINPAQGELDSIERTKKQLYLEIQGLVAKEDYHRRMAKYQAIKLIRSVLIDALIPPLIFASLVFLPLGIGLGVLGAALALAIISDRIIAIFVKDYIVKNAMEPLEEFNEARYNAFNSHPSLEHFSSNETLYLHEEIPLQQGDLPAAEEQPEPTGSPIANNRLAETDSLLQKKPTASTFGLRRNSFLGGGLSTSPHSSDDSASEDELTLGT